MLPVAVLVGREHTYRAERALDRTMWLRPDALMPVEILILKHCAALVAVFVLLPVLTLVQQMVVQSLDLNDLLTLPAGR